MLAVGLTIAVLAGALTFTTNLQRLLNDPHRYGWNWDVKIGAPGLPDFHAFLLPTLTKDPRHRRALSSGTVTQVDVGRARIDVLGARPGTGDALPTMLSGRAPTRPDEIALGAAHAACARRPRRRHDRWRASARRSARLRVVGQPVLPEFGDSAQLGTGSLMTMEGIDRLLPDAPDNSFLVRFRGDAATEGARMARAVEPIPARLRGPARSTSSTSHAGGGLLTALVILISILGFALLLARARSPRSAPAGTSSRCCARSGLRRRSGRGGSCCGRC